MEPELEKIVCVLCENRKRGKYFTVKRGLDTIRRISKERCDNVESLLEGKESVIVHDNCRKAYTRRVPTRIDDEGEGSHQPKRSSRLSSVGNVFDFKQKCMFCGQNIDHLDLEKHPDRQAPFRIVCETNMIHTILEIASKRTDSWGEEVFLRLWPENDLVAAEAWYHRDCYAKFSQIGSRRPTYQPKVFPKPFSGKLSSRGGSTESQDRLRGFQLLCDYLENSDECQHTIWELIDFMKNAVPEEEPYSERHLIRKLQNMYGERVIICHQVGNSSIVCFQEKSHININKELYGDRIKIDETEEKMRIVETAARIIRQEIRSRVYDCSTYPTVEQMSSGNEDLIPTVLQHFLKVVLETRKPFHEDSFTKRKTTSIAHSIISAVRPRSFISPLQLGLGITLHRRYGSRLLLDLLNRLGVCSAYSDAISFEAAVSQNAEPSVDKGAFVQFAFDNADHNVRTLDGHGTFHAMGGIRCITPSKAVQASDPVPRKKSALPTAELALLGSLEVVPYENMRIGTALIVAEDLTIALPEPVSVKQANLIDMLWMWGYHLQETPKPGWNGFMDTITSKKEFKTAKVLPLPFVNLSPSNPTTIYTCLLSAVKICRKAQQSTCVVTFDQPLYAKALDIVLAAGEGSPLRCVVLRLGGFHMLMSYMGAVGTIMAGSGLEELWETVYAKNTLTKMVSGHSYARAVRAHLLTQLSLAILIIQDLEVDHVLSERLKQTHSDLLSEKTSMEKVLSLEVIEQAVDMFDARLKDLVSSGRRTAKLWVRYFEMVGIMRLFVRAERSGDWDLHLLSVQRMIPYFHSAGHLNYAKFAHIYLQQMLKLEEVMNPLEFSQFVKEGGFTVRRSERYWSGIWTDMTIEQVLMKNMKMVGGLTRGRGLKDVVIAKWICTMHSSVNIINAVEKFCGVLDETTDQHVELRESRKVRDKADVRKMVDWLQSHHPFNDSTDLLVSLSTGVVADDTVNCDEALSRGLQAMKSITGQKFSNIHLKRNNKVTTFATSSKKAKIKDTVVEINPNQLFHRLLCVVHDDEDLKEYLKYELAARPPALFDGTLMRKGVKSGFIHVLEKIAPPKRNFSMNAEFTVDGGFLLHRVLWARPANFGQICLQYVRYIKNNFGLNTTVVFDGYKSPSTKDEEHLKRNSNGASLEALIDDVSLSTSTQEAFLANVKNKVRFIALLSKHLLKAGFNIIQAPGDADTLIVQTAVQAANKNGSVSVIVGEDTDLLVLMATTSSPGTNVQMLMPGRKTSESRVFSSQELIDTLGDLRNHLFFHAATGCDTTSGLFRKGKKGSFKKFQRDFRLRQTVSVFNTPDASHQDIAAAGEHFLLALYGCKDENNLNSARHRLYRKTIAKQSIKSMFDIATLPPTSAAAKQHSYRVYHQVQVWMGNCLPETEWGWKENSGRLKPIPTEEEPAPEKVLNILSCSCKSGCEKKCGCRRNGFLCTSMCGYCAGHGCTNRLDYSETDTDDEVEPSTDVLLQDW